MYDFIQIYKYTKDLNVLYVEDDLDLLKESCDIFQDYFKTIDTAIDGKDGLDKYLKYYNENLRFYDIIITDINMPKIDGIRLVKELYKINKNQFIIIISAHDEKDYLLELINLGVEQFLVKPLELDRILTVFYNSSKKIYERNIKDEVSNIINITSEFSWNKDIQQLFYKEDKIKLSKKETLFLNLLLQNKDKVSTIEEIFITLWEEDKNKATIESLKAILSRFRRKYPEIKIENIYGLGYRLIIN